jgi:hypothetical protein
VSCVLEREMFVWISWDEMVDDVEIQHAFRSSLFGLALRSTLYIEIHIYQGQHSLN